MLNNLIHLFHRSSGGTAAAGELGWMGHREEEGFVMELPAADHASQRPGWDWDLVLAKRDRTASQGTVLKKSNHWVTICHVNVLPVLNWISAWTLPGQLYSFRPSLRRFQSISGKARDIWQKFNLIFIDYFYLRILWYII